MMDSMPSPIFIAAPARSGTTLVRYALDSHPRICCPPEWPFLKSIVQALGPFLTEPVGECVDEQKVAALTAQHDLPFSAETYRERLRQLHESFYADYARRAGKARWADNTHVVTDTLICFLDVLYAGEAKFILVSRHGLDTVLSCAAKFGGDVEKALVYWCAVVGLHSAFQESNPERCIRIRYEDLVLRPQEVFDEVLRFVGEEPVPDIAARMFEARHGGFFGDHKIRETRALHTGAVEAWRQVDPEKYRPAVRAQPDFNELMEQLGYAPVPA
jgi:protein-tyrosine sulfotransferase